MGNSEDQTRKLHASVVSFVSFLRNMYHTRPRRLRKGVMLLKILVPQFSKFTGTRILPKVMTDLLSVLPIIYVHRPYEDHKLP